MSPRRVALQKLVDGVGDLRGGVGEVNRRVEFLEDARIIEPVAQCDELRVLREMREASPRGGTRQEGIDDEDIRRDDRGDVLPLTTVVIEEVDDLGFIAEPPAPIGRWRTALRQLS